MTTMPLFTSRPNGNSRARRSVATVARLLRGSRGATSRRTSNGNPFEAVLNSNGDMLKELSQHAISLSPLVKRRIFNGFTGVPEGLHLGWVQLPETGKLFSLGVFTARDRFCQIALADGKGRVFVGTDPDMDTHGVEPRFMFAKEDEIDLPGNQHSGQVTNTRRAIRGGVIGRDRSGHMTWLASWLKSSNRYTLEQMRASLDESMRVGLEYRDAIAIAFFAAYMLPQMYDLLIGFGSGNIFRRLNREAPIGAIRRSIRDTLEARAHGMRASGLEDHFADLMREAGALDKTPGLEAVHGAEPLHLYTSSYSGCFFFAWDSSLAFSFALKSLKIEGNLNRFAAVSTLLEHNAAAGLQPTEDTVTRAQAARIDMALLRDPAIMALRDENDADLKTDPLRDDGIRPVLGLVEKARRQAAAISANNPHPVTASTPTASYDAHGSEWVYRQTMASLIRRLRLPYRFDAEVRSNLAEGVTALAFTTAGASMMPSSRYDVHKHDWVAIDEHDRAAMSTDYNLRVGIMMAAMSFGADERVQKVSLHIDSIGLEEVVAEQDTAIAEMMSQALRAFERIHNADPGLGGSKADPKDGDYHGDPSHSPMLPSDDASANDHAEHTSENENSNERITDHKDTSDTSEHGEELNNGESNATESDSVDNSRTVDERFEDLMRGVDIDEMMFASGNSEGEQDGSDAAEPSRIVLAMDDNSLEALRHNPTVRSMVTVTFTRDEFMARLREDGLNHPQDTYRQFNAAMDMNGDGGLQPIDAQFDLRDGRFSPHGAQEEPELSDIVFSGEESHILGTQDATGLSIQRADLLQRGVTEFHRLAADTNIPTVAKAQQAMDIIERIADPELTVLAPQVTSALIDGNDTPDMKFSLSADLDAERLKARDLLFSGRASQAIDTVQAAIDRVEQMFSANPGVPRYFNSYAERVVYNRLFATPGERTVLIPDNLFYAHMELADVLVQLKGPDAALPHLNAMVSYAPAYPLSHMKLAVQLARNEDWDSARAACLNALRVCLDRDDAAFAYYRFAYTEWMRDEFDVAVAAYIMSEYIAPGHVGTLSSELRELVARAESQCIAIPTDVDDAKRVLADHGLPIWPNTEVLPIVRDAARICVDGGMFVPARTLSVAAARMDDESKGDGIDAVQAQFLRSLNL